jgi:GDPmannose 4,6-dehydratase
MPDRALITGISGQDGSYLAESLVADEIEVHGLVRGGSERDLPWLEPIRDRLVLHDGDLRDALRIRAVIDEVRPHQLFHLGTNVDAPR